MSSNSGATVNPEVAVLPDQEHQMHGELGIRFAAPCGLNLGMKPRILDS